MASKLKKDDLLKMSFGTLRDLYSELPLTQGKVSDDQAVVIEAACEMIQDPKHNNRTNRGKLEEIKGWTPRGDHDSAITVALALAKNK